MKRSEVEELAAKLYSEGYKDLAFAVVGYPVKYSEEHPDGNDWKIVHTDPSKPYRYKPFNKDGNY